MPTPNDKELYEKIKKEIYKKYPTHSAYRSGLLVQKYKEEYLKKHKNNNAYNGSREQSNLKIWLDEKWRSDKGKVGDENKGDIYRPTIRINSKTPTTINELTQSQINRAKQEKKLKGRVKKFNV